MKFHLQPRRLTKNTLIKIIAIWVILGVVGDIGFHTYKKVKDRPLSAEVEEEVAFAYAPAEVEDSNPFEEYIDEGYRYGIHRMKEEEYLEEFEEEYVTPEGYIDTRPAPITRPGSIEKGAYAYRKNDLPEEAPGDDLIVGGDVPRAPESTKEHYHFQPEAKQWYPSPPPAPPVATVAPTSLLSEAVLVSLITTIGATLNTLLLVFKKNK